MTALIYLGDCASLHGADVDELNRMCERATDITYTTMRKHVGTRQLQDWAACVGYSRRASQGLTLNRDWHVSYHKSKWKGATCYFLRWSAFEHIWVSA